jgi:UDP-glucose 4-epimerase
MTRALVTGGTGFVGANLIRHLLRNGHETHLLIRPQAQLWRIHDVADQLAIHSVARTEDVRSLLRTVAPNWIFNLAAHGAYPAQTNLHEMITTNISATFDLLNAALETGFEAFVQAGSSSEYGFKDHPPREHELPEPNSDYAVTKLAASTYCRYIAARHGANVKVLRLYSVYGPWEEPTRLIPRMIACGIEGRVPPLANAATARDFVYVEDVCDAFLAATAPVGAGEVYNIGTGKQVTLAEAVDVIRNIFAIALAPQWDTMASRPWDSCRWVADPSKAKDQLGWVARTPFREGVQRTIEWLRLERAVHDRYLCG